MPDSQQQIAIIRFIVSLGCVALLAMICLTSTRSTRPLYAKEGPDGQKVYDANCAVCHGPAGHLGDIGRGLGAKDLRSVESQRLSDAEIRERIMHGKGTMPPFQATLSEDDIDAVTRYLRSLKPDEDPKQ